jgi:hypothetical protein
MEKIASSFRNVNDVRTGNVFLSVYFYLMRKGKAKQEIWQDKYLRIIPTKK